MIFLLNGHGKAHRRAVARLWWKESQLIKGEGLLNQMQGDFVLLKLLADGFARRGVGEQGVHYAQRA
ncbi:hypothetical protein SAMN05216214_106130 [Atopomonas hussainii]|uniref:Uncharacterized protein n=1 Tax=Atopomonas hussainii TaxID=1429083 RepID=A0A1H7L121_9GAMM|nr:hypothetical protein SAMN05216214_106130 [Atopomonas hussainii]